MADHVSIIIPSRNERHLQRTIDSLLTNAAGDVEVIAILDGGPWPDPPLKDDKRLIVVRHNEPMGMRPSINEGAHIASGTYLMKCDAHCIFCEGYDEILKRDCDRDWLVVPTRHSIDGPTWERDGEKAAVRKRDFNYSILTYPFMRSAYGEGFHAINVTGNLNARINQQRSHLAVDDIIGAQGSCWFQRREYFLWFPPLDHATLGFYQESQEMCFRILASGGRCVVQKQTWYAHLHKGKQYTGADGRPGRGYFVSLKEKDKAEAVVTSWCLDGWPSTWPNAHRTFLSMVEQHWWLISQIKDSKYSWPEDWRDFDKHRTWFKNRRQEDIPQHLERGHAGKS